MRITIIAGLFLILLSVPSFGQLKGGLKAGLNIADLIITDGENYFGEGIFKTRASYHFGSYVRKNFSPNFGFQVEMLFSNKGCKIESDSLNSDVSLNYLNWPLLLTYQLGDRLVFGAGLELGLLIAGEDIYRDFDLGVDVGAEYEVSRKLNVGFRYNHGFPFKMNTRSFERTGTEPTYRQSVIQFYLGFNLVNEPAE